jgi:hypothetical protein
MGYKRVKLFETDEQPQEAPELKFPGRNSGEPLQAAQ